MVVWATKGTVFKQWFMTQNFSVSRYIPQRSAEVTKKIFWKAPKQVGIAFNKTAANLAVALSNQLILNQCLTRTNYNPTTCNLHVHIKDKISDLNHKKKFCGPISREKNGEMIQRNRVKKTVPFRSQKRSTYCDQISEQVHRFFAKWSHRTEPTKENCSRISILIQPTCTICLKISTTSVLTCQTTSIRTLKTSYREKCVNQ